MSDNPFTTGEKPRNVSNVIIIPDGSVHRAMCMDCEIRRLEGKTLGAQFDVSGAFEPATEDGTESEVVKKILEHLENCEPRKGIESTIVMKNVKDPEHPIYKLSVTWVT